MNSGSQKTVAAVLVGASMVWLPLGCEGGRGPAGPAGPGFAEVIDASTTPPEVLGEIDVMSQITGVNIASPPVVTFSLSAADGTPIVGIVPFWEDSNRYVRFTMTKLVAGQNGDPDSNVAYVRDAGSGEPDYDTGSSLVDNGDGTYTFTFNTDVTTVPGIPYDPTLTHRVAGQIGSNAVALEPQNLWMDFVPNGGPVARTRRIATMVSCNECHSNLVFHGRRFEVEYCVQCHNPDLAEGEGDFSFMIHRIHSAGDFAVLDGGISYAGLTYPQDLQNCRKCHSDADAGTPEADNWRTLPSMWACAGCHDNFGPNASNMHTGPPLPDNQACVLCHGPGQAVETESMHATANATPNNPNLMPGQRNISYELVDAVVDGMTNDLTVQFRILSDGTPLDMTNLPADLADLGGDVFRYPDLLMAWAMPQDGINEPADFNNLGRRAAQPPSLSMGDFSPIEMVTPVGTLSFDAMAGVNTAVVTDGPSQFPMGATMRTVAIQNYLQQDLDGDGSSDVSLHALSTMVAVTGDTARRKVVDSENCSSCHEWFEGHGGNRVFGFGSDIICTMCHNPNLSSSGRTVVDPTLRGLDADIAAAVADGSLDPSVDPMNPRSYPEDSNNFKDLIHGIHSSGFRDRAFQHVRGPGRQDYYDWSHVTFPRGASVSECTLCHMDGTFELPLSSGLLATTVRTTGQDDGMDPDQAAAEAAFVGVPGNSDWINSPGASSCFGCHTSGDAWAHMTQNGGLLSIAPFGGGGARTNRSALGGTFEACSVCHGPGRSADVTVVHNR